MKKAIIIATVMLASLGGCANNTSGIYASSTGNVTVYNRSFGNDVNVSNLTATPEGGLLKGRAMISSTDSSDQKIQYKFTWLDASNNTIDDESFSWKTISLHGYQQLQVNSVAPNPTATHFEIYVREVFSN